MIAPFPEISTSDKKEQKAIYHNGYCQMLHVCCVRTNQQIRRYPGVGILDLEMRGYNFSLLSMDVFRPLQVQRTTALCQARIQISQLHTVKCHYRPRRVSRMQVCLGQCPRSYHPLDSPTWLVLVPRVLHWCVDRQHRMVSLC